MGTYIKITLAAIWGAFFIYWFVSGIRAKKPGMREAPLKRFLWYWLPPIAAGLLLGPGPWFGHSFLREKCIPHTDAVGIAGLSVCLAGLTIAFWARYVLGKNWSLSVQKKENHELISDGPYRWVRHPIYTGVLLLFCGTALIVGEWRGVLSVAVLGVSFWIKLKREERLLSEVFGETYRAYMRRTKALLPFLI